ncbi:ABC transporter substrate-binding protein [Gleimia sp. 6138-11-ORH1]|uniref:ABC transporter substrate-binding protein n=1 Tax=Gleimia sp. 6138-11-ORH1 TaxID=2973937 RepID=UPI002168CEC7|nr:ABC transporter substrate-binding protein [Gleimia sp. 6138-11-ORH1]MCS4485196.1 ABC transporter substrate-binding protein [Gleimia sp. 6138-11-ORH1]
MRQFKLFAGVAAAALVLAACGGGTTGGTSGTDNNSTTGANGKAWEGDASEVVITTWWEAGSEKVGFDALSEVFKQKYPDIKFTKAAIAGGGGSQAKQKLAADLAAGSPPDTFQAHAGAELTDYIDADQILDVSGLYDELKLKEAFPATLVEQLTSDGKIYSVPSNIHRANVVWANPEVLKEAGIDPSKQPEDLDAWIADMEKIQAKGKTPLTLGVAWTRLHLFETILLADLGAEKYNGLFNGTTKWDSEEVTKAIKHFEKILTFTDKALYTEDWEPAMQPVVDGKAAYNVMGDWAVGAFNAQNKVDGTDYIYFPVPGTQGTFDFLADSFTLPKGAAHPGGTRAWLDVISSKEGQIAFNLAKGSIPARADLSDEERAKFPKYQQSAMESFGKDTIVSSIAHGAALPVKQSNAISDAVAKFVEGGSDATQFQAELVQATK